MGVIKILEDNYKGEKHGGKIEKMKKNEKRIDANDIFFGDLVICAVRYSLWHMSYMPELVAKFIEPLIPYLRHMTLAVIDRDLDTARNSVKRLPDHARWKKFHENVKREIEGRSESEHE